MCLPSCGGGRQDIKRNIHQRQDCLEWTGRMHGGKKKLRRCGEMSIWIKVAPRPLAIQFQFCLLLYAIQLAAPVVDYTALEQPILRRYVSFSSVNERAGIPARRPEFVQSLQNVGAAGLEGGKQELPTELLNCLHSVTIDFFYRAFCFWKHSTPRSLVGTCCWMDSRLPESNAILFSSHGHSRAEKAHLLRTFFFCKQFGS